MIQLTHGESGLILHLLQGGVDKGEMTSPLLCPSPSVVGGRVGPEAMRVDELTLSPTSSSNMERRQVLN